jgi:SAM-dependent methyltransferase
MQNPFFRGIKVNNRRGREPIARDTYEDFAEDYAARVRTKSHNALIERPAMLSLLPDVTGMRVLDAGCGPGVYAEMLVNLGADVVALDVSLKMIEIARQSLGDRVSFHIANLEEPLDFLEDESFDLILSSLVLDYIYDWDNLLFEYIRLLRPGGIFVFSVGHPMADFRLPGSCNYFKIKKLEYTWTGFGKPVLMPFYRRSFEAMIGPLRRAGFAIDEVIEPKPVSECKESDPEVYETRSKRPTFICFRAQKQ